MIDIVKLMEYTQYLRHRYLDTLSQLSWDEVVKDRAASFGSLRNIYLHCVACVEFIYHVIHAEPTFSQINYDDYESIDKIQAYLGQVESKFNAYLRRLTPEELARNIPRKQRDGSTTIATVEDNLIHLFQEEIHHIGEFIALLWQIDVRPPHIGWIQYLNKY
jgi:uncharacterized damage-inducible protein DinB